MANLYDFTSYVNNVAAKYVFKNTSGATRFFGFINTNGKEVADQEVVLVPENDLNFMGPVTRAAINSEVASGILKFGQHGVTFYAFKVDNGAFSSTQQLTRAGKVVGVYVADRTGTTGTNVVATLRGNDLTNGTVALPAAATACAEYTLTSTTANLVCKAGDALVLGVSANPTAGHTTVVIVAIAHHSF